MRPSTILVNTRHATSLLGHRYPHEFEDLAYPLGGIRSHTQPVRRMGLVVLDWDALFTPATISVGGTSTGWALRPLRSMTQPPHFRYNRM